MFVFIVGILVSAVGRGEGFRRLTPEELTVRYGFSPTSEYVLAQARPIDLREIFKDVPLVIIGEAHIYVSSKKLLYDNMELLKEMGVTHIALEMFNVVEQPIVDQYQNGRIPLSEVIEKSLKPNWGYLPEEYAKVLEAATQQKIKVVAVDIRDKVRDDPRDAIRNKNFAQQLSRIFSNEPSAKVVMLTGSMHAIRCCSGSLMPKFLEELKIPYRTYQVEVPKLKHLFGAKTILVRQVEEQHISTRFTFIPMPRPYGIFDGHLFLEALEPTEEFPLFVPQFD